MLSVDALEAAYERNQVLFGTTFEVGRGEVVALMGRNGMGKTTSVHCIVGVVRPLGGRVLFEGLPLDGLPPYRIARRGIALVPEGRQIFPTLTVRENLVATAANYGELSTPWTTERVFELFPQLRERRNQLGGTLSGGEQQMLAIGRGLASAPKLLMLDEPSMGLAPAVADTIFERVSQIHREDRVTILLVEQRVAEALELSDYGYVLETGHMVLDGTHQTLLADDRVRRSYLGLTDA
jgi:branched-chain amino acid transport system ATP-binding protein